MSHDDLCALAVRWLRNTGRCSWVVREPTWHSGGATEQPDAFGWSSPNQTVLVECKATRSDFLADKSKWFRRYPAWGIGRFRYYLAPAGVIRPDDLPPRWGLIVASGDRCRRQVKAAGQLVWGQDMEARFCWALLAKLERRAPRLQPDGKLPPWVDEP
jgi:hypothetical protein